MPATERRDDAARPSSRSALSFKSDSMPLNRIPSYGSAGSDISGDCHDERLFHHSLPLHRLCRRRLPVRLQCARGAGYRARSREDLRLRARLWLRLRRRRPRPHLRQRCGLRNSRFDLPASEPHADVFHERSPDLSFHGSRRV